MVLTFVEFVLKNRSGDTISLFVVGGCLGEAAMPVVVGYLLLLIGPASFSAFVFLSILFLVLDYVAVHRAGEVAARARAPQDII